MPLLFIYLSLRKNPTYCSVFSQNIFLGQVSRSWMDQKERTKPACPISMGLLRLRLFYLLYKGSPWALILDVLLWTHLSRLTVSISSSFWTEMSEGVGQWQYSYNSNPSVSVCNCVLKGFAAKHQQGPPSASQFHSIGFTMASSGSTKEVRGSPS